LGMTVFLHPATNVLDEVSIIPLQLFRESYLALPDATEMEVKLEQEEKADSHIFVTLLGM
jgi:hypothetical protein